MTIQDYTGQYETMKDYAECMANDAALSKTRLDTTIEDYARLYWTKYD